MSPMSHNGNVPLVTLRKALQAHNSAFSLYTDEETGETKAYAVYRDTRIGFHITKDEIDTICQDCLNRLAKDAIWTGCDTMSEYHNVEATKHLLRHLHEIGQ